MRIALQRSDLTERDIARFRSTPIIQQAECMIWGGAIASNGYGAFWRGRRDAGAHRLAWLLAQKDSHATLHVGDEVCHACDNPPCVNPAHLFRGSRAENLLDARTKGRLHRFAPQPGEAHHHARLTDQQVRFIRERFAQGVRQSVLAQLCGVTHSAIAHVVHGRSWTHVR